MVYAVHNEEDMSKDNTEPLWIRCVLEGDVARMYRELESRGLVKSIREAVAQGITALYEKVMERDLLEARAKTSVQLAEQID